MTYDTTVPPWAQDGSRRADAGDPTNASAAAPASTTPVSRAARFKQFLDADAFPCVGAKAAMSRGVLEVHEAGALGDARGDAKLLDGLHAFAVQLDAAHPDDPALHSFAAVFDGPLGMDEQRFEALLWAQLQRLHDLDRRRGASWAGDVSADPRDPDFSLSLGGHPFFVIGLHPGASRRARRFDWPTLVFNSHRQFQRLRGDGRYARMQAATRSRDIALQGSINPNLAEFGSISEARQYSGRAVGPDWTCPMRVRKAAG